MVFKGRDTGGTAGAGEQGAGLLLGTLGRHGGHMGTPQLREGWQGQAGRNAGPGMKGRSRSAPGPLVAQPRGSQSGSQDRLDSPLALQGQGWVNPLPSEGARLSDQCLCALEAAGAMPEGSPGLLLPAGRGAAVPQPLRWTCKGRRVLLQPTSGTDRQAGLPAFPLRREPTGRARATSRHIRPGPRPPALSKGRTALGLLLTAVPQDRQGWVPAMPGLRSSRRPSPWKYFPGRFQNLREVLLMQPEIEQLQHRVK